MICSRSQRCGACSCGKPDPVRCEEQEANFKTFAAVLDQSLARQRFIVNDRLTIADFCLAAPLTYAAEAQLPLAGFGNLQRWLLALDEQPGWRGSRPPPM